MQTLKSNLMSTVIGAFVGLPQRRLLARLALAGGVGALAHARRQRLSPVALVRDLVLLAADRLGAKLRGQASLAVRAS